MSREMELVGEGGGKSASTCQCKTMMTLCSVKCKQVTESLTLSLTVQTNCIGFPSLISTAISQSGHLNLDRCFVRQLGLISGSSKTGYELLSALLGLRLACAGYFQFAAVTSTLCR